ncbi:Uncharacterized protein FWK35_00019035 [Aphis craccivora]|uniref:Uncharacterized protein n=1 Tax=Aphis craccivora TaxID=307492 RepID=A0A6G0XNJ4_APHCR|nr:Uncharacterized protein FWK35_00019035 [Aphis craccivora]
MITLPDRPLSTQDIIKYVRKLKINHFRGVFSRDNLKNRTSLNVTYLQATGAIDHIFRYI